MKNLSIKLKITLWYTVFMTILIIVILWLLFSISSSQVLSNAQLRLKDTVTRSFHEIEYEDGVLEFDKDINFLGEGIYISVYSAQGALLYGRTPSLFHGAPMLIMDEIQQVTSGQNLWYVYDYCQKIDGYGNLWVRGIASQTQTDAALHILVRLALIFLPFFVLCIAAGGYLIIRKTLAPLADMTETARQISEGNDLSQRIRVGEGKDEVHKMAHTFDRMMDKLQASFENEKQFTSDVSHELRTPVAVILSQCEYASREDTTPEETRGCIRAITNQARKMSNLISQLLTLARADSGKQQLHPEILNLSELAEIITEEQRSLAVARNITLETDIQPDILFCGDETMLMRLFINLISNSITYGRQNGHTLITLSSGSGYITGSVADDGIGIEKDKLDKIWNRFYQVDSARSSGERQGSGLGLPMVKWITQAHKGTISVESSPGEGTRFTFTFPAQPRNAEK
ncbi:sensor histidine kinase [Eisenbergiella porci]|uniref:sensor histidine kinase n=2 Tax=Eisenbergiella TaxID=1432051 RepID=UPI003A90A5AE